MLFLPITMSPSSMLRISLVTIGTGPNLRMMLRKTISYQTSEWTLISPTPSRT
jgi:hypothetical protein